MHNDGYFDSRIANLYDEIEALMFEPKAIDPVVDLLQKLAADGRALELGVGTGRIAIPLSRRGVPVHGIDISKAMAAKLREKPEGRNIGVTIGDFTTATVAGRFNVAFLVFNTIMNLTNQPAQVLCFRNLAAHLAPQGFFVVEVVVPDLQNLPRGETIQSVQLSPTEWDFDEYDVVSQRLTSHHYRLLDGNVENWSVPFRYVWPSELDLMAQSAGLELRHRWGGWSEEPFTSESRMHVSVWQLK